jgi:hypothetical protein
LKLELNFNQKKITNRRGLRRDLWLESLCGGLREWFFDGRHTLGLSKARLKAKILPDGVK